MTRHGKARQRGSQGRLRALLRRVFPGPPPVAAVIPLRGVG